MSPLSPKQQEVLALLEGSIAANGYPPTRAEIAKALGLASTNGVQQHLKALERKGALSLDEGSKSRGIRLTPSVGAKPKKKNRNALAQATTERPAPLVTQTAKLMRVLGSVAQSPVTLTKGFIPSLLSLPLIGRVAAGRPILAEAHIEAHYHLDPALFDQVPDYLLRVEGMSMRDAGILHGDLIAVKRTTDIKSGQIVVARLDDEVTVKRFKRIAGRLELRPENPEFDTLVVATGDTPHVPFVPEGVCVGVIRGRG